MNKKVLLIVEGNKTEPKIFNKIQELFGLDFEIFCFGTNIYSLYKLMKENDFNVNIKDLLAEVHPEYKNDLDNQFVYTYLIFDLDPHHSKKEETRTIEELVNENIEIVESMANYFVDETDPTIGKLYINYPMIESYKDCNDFFDKNYETEVIAIDKIVDFKEIVGKKKLSNIRVDKYNKDNVENLIIQNIFKMNSICKLKWEMPDYNDYIDETNNVLNAEKRMVLNTKQISVLNTSLFLVVDYFGDKEGFYTNLSSKSLIITKH